MAIAKVVRVAFDRDTFATSGGSFTDISAYAMPRLPIAAGRGELIDQPEPGVVTVRLLNTDGRFTPGNTSSPYSPNVVPRKQVQIDLGGERVFTGWVDSWEAHDGGLRETSVCVMRCVDILGMYARHDMVGVQLRDWVLGNAEFTSGPGADAYARLGAGESLAVIDETDGRVIGQYMREARVGISGGAVADPDEGADLGNRERHVALNRSASPTGSTFAVAFLVLVRSLPGADHDRIWGYDQMAFDILSSGQLRFTAPGLTRTQGTPTTGAWFSVAIRKTSTTGYQVRVYQAGEQVTAWSDTGSSYTPTSAANHVWGADSGVPDLDGAVDELAVWRSDPGDTRMLYVALRMAVGLDFSFGLSRIYIADVVGALAWTVSDNGYRPYISVTGYGGGSVLSRFQQFAVLTGQTLRARKSDGFAHFHARGYPSSSPPVVMTLGTGGIPVRDAVPLARESDIYRSVVVTDGARTLTAPVPGADSTAGQAQITTHAGLLKVNNPPFQNESDAADPADVLGFTARRSAADLEGIRRARLSVQLGTLTSGQQTTLLSGLEIEAQVRLVVPLNGAPDLTGVWRVTRYHIDVGSVDDVRVELDVAQVISERAVGSVAGSADDQSLPNVTATDLDLYQTRLATHSRGWAPDEDTSGPVLIFGGSVWISASGTGARELQARPGSDRARQTVPGVSSSAVLITSAGMHLPPSPSSADQPVGVRVYQDSGGSLTSQAATAAPWIDPNWEFGPWSWWFKAPSRADRCLAYRTTAKSIANNSLTTVDLNAEEYDSASMHSNATNNERINFQSSTQVLLVTANASFAANSTGRRVAQLEHVSGGVDRFAEMTSRAVSGIETAAAAIGLVRATGSGQHVRLNAFQNSGGALNLVAADWSPRLGVVEMLGSACRIRRTTNVSIPNNSETALASTTAVFDVGGLKSGDTIVLDSDGLWMVGYGVEWAANTSGIRQAFVRVADRLVLAPIYDGGDGNPHTLSDGVLVEARSGDVVTLGLLQTSGGALNANGSVGGHSYSITLWAAKVAV